MSYSTRVYRQRNAHVHDNDANKEQSSFFSKLNQRTTVKGNQPSFFQAKLFIGQPDDACEREADAAAGAVLNHRHDPAVQQKNISRMQRYATPLEDEKISTNDERMKHDREIREQPEAQASCPAGEEQEQGMYAAVQTKADGAGPVSPQLSSKIEDASGKGDKLSQKVLAEMNHSFAADFSRVNIHTGSESVQMNKALGAQAFTHGNDIYFNSGRFNPDTAAGKQLLAHELTHVVQQGYAQQENNIQRQPDWLGGFDPFNEEDDSVAATAAGAGGGAGIAQNNQMGGTDLLGGFANIVPLSLPAWTTDFLGITLLSSAAACTGTASPGRTVPMSLCNAAHFCTTPATFNFNLFFHFDIDLVPRPQPFTDANVSVGIDFIPDGRLVPSFSKHQSGTGIYAGAGAPLITGFGNNFSFTTDKDGTLSVFTQMIDTATGTTVTYIDNIRCTITPCA